MLLGEIWTFADCCVVCLLVGCLAALVAYLFGVGADGFVPISRVYFSVVRFTGLAVDGFWRIVVTFGGRVWVCFVGVWLLVISCLILCSLFR